MIDWSALLEVAFISAAAGLAIAVVLGVGIVAALRAQDATPATALGLNAVTAVSVVLVAAALVAGVYFITDK
jgi:hypothetical protein